MNEIAIKFENISKQYRLGLVSTKTLSHDLNRWWQTKILQKEDPYLKIGEINNRSEKGNSEYVWALNDINLDVRKGEVLGIIGKNGAGKSTLLKILSRVTSPSKGIIKAKGRIGSLLEVGTGFHPELTGRENIFMNGLIMGMTKSEITRKLDEIVEFAGVARYLDTPVKRYSSGMTVRLGFSIAAHLEPEILVVDEVLAVGDAEFQKKAVGKMQDVSLKDGRTILFVSHNMGVINSLCNKLCCLTDGGISYYGDVEKGIQLYLSENNSLINKKVDIADIPEDIDIKLTDVYIDSEGKEILKTSEPIDIYFNYIVKNKVMALRIGFDLHDNQTGVVLFRSFHDDMNKEIEYTLPGEYISKARIPANLLREGSYKISISITVHCVKWLEYDKINLDFTLKNIDGVNSIYSDLRPGVISPVIEWKVARKDK